jgi:hypothetical protein
MTLVVAQQSNDVIAIAADTGVVEHGSRLGKDQQVVKIVRISPHLCVAFAGGVELAFDAIDRAHNLARTDFKTLTEHFLGCHREANGHVDFLLLFNFPAKRIVKISGGQITKPMGCVWIGDKAAFEVFQRNRKVRVGNGVIPQGMQITTNLETEAHRDNHLFDLVGTLHKTISAGGQEAVFGDVVAANNVEGEFRFRPYSIMLKPQDGLHRFGSAQLARAQAELSEDLNFSASAFISEPGSKMTGYPSCLWRLHASVRRGSRKAADIPWHISGQHAGFHRCHFGRVRKVDRPNCIEATTAIGIWHGIQTSR